MTPPAISVEHLSVRLGDSLALQDLSFAIEPGTFTAVIGPNGAGKSTLFKVLLGLIAPEHGSILIEGSPPERLPAESIGYVPQVKSLARNVPALTLELVATGLRPFWPWRLGPALRKQALDALDQAGAAHLAYRSLGELSGGELQRVYLARSFARKPRLILLDEPATGLDAVGEAAMYHIVEAYQQHHRATVLMITHDWDGARLHASRVLLLNRRLMGFGLPSSVLQDEALLQVFGHTGHTHSSYLEGGRNA